jgi:NADH:ubiquinone oxidoreductase subunit F (NADH-binding)
VREPGVKLAPAGISLRELVDEHCGGMAEGDTLYAYLPGGASGGILPASAADLPLDFDTLQAHGCFIGSAAVIVLSQRDRARDAAANLMRFFRDESCGQCTPCRVGTAKAAQLLEAGRWDVPLLRELSAAMMDASICGLGQAAPNPMLSVIERFEHEIGGEPGPGEARPAPGGGVTGGGVTDGGVTDGCATGGGATGGGATDGGATGGADPGPARGGSAR